MTTIYPCRSFSSNIVVHNRKIIIGFRNVPTKTSTQLYHSKEVSNNNKRPTVAIIGGGIAGLSCAQHLDPSKYDVTVYDTGRLRPGGRASSRQPNDPPAEDDNKNYPILSKYRYDHAAQFISCRSTQEEKRQVTSWRKDFDQQVMEWVNQGILKEAPRGSIYVLEEDDKTTTPTTWKPKAINNQPKEDDNKPSVQFYYPVNGMSSLTSDALTSGGTFKLEQDVWVSPSSGVRYLSSKKNDDNNNSNKWQLRANGRVLGEYSHLVLAHNGKCADRIMSKTPAKDVHSLLRVNFSDRVPGNGGQKMTLNSLYSLTFCLKSPSILAEALPTNFLGGFIQQHPKLSMVTCQTTKYPPHTYEMDSNDKQSEEGIEVWNIISSASFAKKHKAPQEFLPDEVVSNVTQLLVGALQEDIIGKGSSDISLLDQVLDSRVQLWGAAVPMNVWRSDDSLNCGGCIYDAEYQVGVCGDWLVDPSIAGAWTSGRDMAKHLQKESTMFAKNEAGIGTNGHFEASQGVKRLGIASLDTPTNKNTQSMSPPRNSQDRKWKPNNNKGTNNVGKNQSNQQQKQNKKNISLAQ
jgi:predicted NAD/FAD-dependent oxidoreductase